MSCEIRVMVDGVPVPTTPFDHPHGRPEDLFLLVEPPEPVPLGTEITWAGVMPEGKKNLWVRSLCAVPRVTEGNFLLRETDRGVPSSS